MTGDSSHGPGFQVSIAADSEAKRGWSSSFHSAIRHSLRPAKRIANNVPEVLKSCGNCGYGTSSIRISAGAAFDFNVCYLLMPYDKVCLLRIVDTRPMSDNQVRVSDLGMMPSQQNSDLIFN